MGIGPVFLEFLRRIAIGAGAVLALFVLIQLRLPGRAARVVTRRTIK
jgi:hypothetical protein